MNTSILRGIESLPYESHEEVQSWFDTFCKTVPFQISGARLIQPVEPEKEQGLFITCKTSLRHEADILIEALDSDDETVIDGAIALLQKSFDRVIQTANLPRKARIAGQEIALTWIPEELSLFEREPCSPQQQSISERNLRALVCLETVNMVMDSDRIFEDKWLCSNDPFLSAGLLATGDWVWMDQFGPETVSTKKACDLLRERVGLHPGRYLMLLRLAQLAKYDGDLQHTWAQIKQFGNRMWLDRVNLRYWTDTILEGDSFSLDEMVLPMDAYTRLDQEVDIVGSLLMASVKRQEHEIPRMINAALTCVKVPQPALFRCWQQ